MSTTKKSAYSAIFTSFLQENFGKTIGLRLLRMAEKKQNTVFEDLDTAEQFEFIKKTLYSMYKKFYPAEKIRVFVLEIFFRHLRQKIENQLEIVSTKNAHMKDVTLQFSLLQNKDDLVALTKNDLKLYLTVNEPIQARCIIVIDEASCRTIMRAHSAMHDKKYSLDTKTDPSAIQEFLEALFPAIEVNLKKTFGTALQHEFTNKETIIEQFTESSDDYIIEMITTTCTATLDNESMVLDMTFLVKSSDEEMLQKAKKQKQREVELLFEQSPTKIFASFKSDIKANCIEFLEKVIPQQASSVIEEVCTTINCTLDKPLPPKEMRTFIGHVVSQHSDGWSDNKKRCVRENLEVILGKEQQS